MKRTFRKLAAAFGLAGVALYTLLLPLHLTSQFDRQLFAAEFGTTASLICSTTQPSDPTSPAAPDSSCPICKGLAAFQFALAVTLPQVALPPPVRSPLRVSAREDATSALVPRPRSRGPPSQA